MTTNDTRTPRELAANKAWLRDLDRDDPIHGGCFDGYDSQQEAFEAGYLDRDAETTTVTAEQIEQAAEGLATQDNRLWTVMGEVDREQYREFARAAFRAAGFRIEGDEA